MNCFKVMVILMLFFNLGFSKDFCNDKKDGVYSVYIKKIECKNQKMLSMTLFNKNGNPSVKIISNNSIKTLIFYYKNRKIRSFYKSKKGKMITHKTYYKDGKPNIISDCINNILTVKIYDKDGNLVQKN